MENQDMEQHRRILGILFIVSSALTLLVGLGMGGFLAVLGSLSHPHGTGHENREGLLIAAAIAGYTFLLGLPGIITGVGLLKRQRWAKVWALVLGILSLTNFPLGTALGIYALWFYTRPRSNQVFA